MCTRTLSSVSLLRITAPTKACGKSTLAEVIGALAKTPRLMVNATPAVIFRLIDRDRPCLIADETEMGVVKQKKNYHRSSMVDSPRPMRPSTGAFRLEMTSGNSTVLPKGSCWHWRLSNQHHHEQVSLHQHEEEEERGHRMSTN